MTAETIANLHGLNQKYKDILQNVEPSVISKTLDILKRKKENHGDTFPYTITDDIGEVFKLLENYRSDVKRIFVSNNETLTHITGVSPERLEGGVLRRTRDIANEYETEYGNYFFASSTPIDGKNLYLARKSSSGMIRLASDIYVFGGDNFEVRRTDSENRVYLKEPNYIYSLSVEPFMPTVTLKLDSNGKPFFEFSEEWVSEEDIDILDQNKVRKISKVDDITSVAYNYQILCDKNSKGIGRKVCEMPLSERIGFILGNIESGNLRYINGEAEINVHPFFYQSQSIKKDVLIKMKEELGVVQQGYNSVPNKNKSH